MLLSTMRAPLQPTSGQFLPACAASDSPLSRAERAGVIDALLVVVAVVQYFAIERYFRQTGQPLFTPVGRLPAWLIAPATATWTLLTAGALAPLLRRRAARRPGQLPRGAGLLLFAWALMFVVWVVLLFNVVDEALWGFWHIARLECDSYMLLASLVPLALAPGWRRLVRAVKRALLARRRAPLRIPFLPALAVAAGLLYAWLLGDRAIMSDGWGMIAMARENSPLAPEGYREPLFLLLFRELYKPLSALGLNAARLIGGSSTLATLAVFAMLHRRMRRWNYTRSQLAAGWLLILSTLGLTQMFLGHVELYPLLIFGLVGTLHTGLDAMERRCSPAWPALFYAFVLAGHLSAIFILPAVILIFWLRAVPAGRLCGPVDRPALVRGCAHLFGWGCLLHLPLWTALALKLPHPSLSALVGAVTGSLNTGAENLTFIGSNESTFASQLGDVLGPANLFKVVQALFYLAGGPFLACIVAVAARALGYRPAVPASAGRPDPKTAAVLWVAFLGYGFYALAWHADWSWREDWDLFSALAPLALLLALRLLMPARGVVRLPLRLLATVSVFAGALAFTQHVYNHTHASFLNNMNKIDYHRDYGRFIQHEQIIKAYPRFTLFEYKDGRVVIHPPGGRNP